MRRILILALLVMPIYADTFVCDATATDPSGVTHVSSCPVFFQQAFYSSITASGGQLNVNFENYVFFEFGDNAPPPSGWTHKWYGEQSTSTSGEFKITGGTGPGQLIANADGESGGGGIFNGTGTDNYESNFLPVPPAPYGIETIKVPFTFNVPFTLTVADEITFSGFSGPDAGGFFFEDIEAWHDVNFGVFDNNGHPVLGASVSAVPEASSVWLLTIAGLALLPLRTQTLRQRSRR